MIVVIDSNRVKAENHLTMVNLPRYETKTNYCLVVDFAYINRI